MRKDPLRNAINEAIDNIHTRHPSLNREEIAQIASDVVKEFEGAAVRDFIPLFVERRIEKLLRR